MKARRKHQSVRKNRALKYKHNTSSSVIIPALIFLFFIAGVIGIVTYINAPVIKPPQPTTLTFPIPTETPTETPETIQVPQNDTWREYFPKCKGLSNNVRIFLPSSWLVGVEYGLYDGPYADHPTTQAELDFNNLVSHCGLSIAFPVKPRSRQDTIDPKMYGEISIEVDKIHVPKNLQKIEKNIKDSESYSASDQLQYKMINNHQFLVDAESSGRYIFYQALNNSYSAEVDVRLLMPHPGKEIDSYIINTVEDFVQKLIIK